MAGHVLSRSRQIPVKVLTFNGCVRALLVDPDVGWSQRLIVYLERAGYEVQWAPHYRRGHAWVEAMRYDLIVLDVVLPPFDGVVLCRAARSEGPNTETPILMVSARCAEADRVCGLEAGADDYVCKPSGWRK